MLKLWGCAPLNIQSSHRAKNNPAKTPKKEKKISHRATILTARHHYEFSSIKVAGFEKNSCPNHIAEPDSTPLCKIIGQPLNKSNVGKAVFNLRCSSVAANLQVNISRVDLFV